MKLYLIDFVDNKKANVVVILIGMLGNYGMVVALNVIGLKVNSLNGKLSFLNTSCSPFILMMVIGMFNIARNMRLNNRLICCVSKLSMFMYIIHENVILRYYYRPMMWQYVYCNYGYDNILIWYLLMVLAVFCFAFVASVIYKNTIQKLVKKMADKLYMQVVMCAYGVESVLLKFK
jgi:hypothetical protein